MSEYEEDWSELVKENQKLRELLADERANVRHLSDENERLLKDIDKTLAALKRHGLHTWDCAFNDTRGKQPCDCGWTPLEMGLATLTPNKRWD